MLSQNDFRNLLSTPSVNDSGKTRFDLKQISQWDKQNKQSHKSKNSKGTDVDYPGKKTVKKTEEEEDANNYRDRASERRKDFNPDYDKEKIELAMKLDVEKSKLMGGDLENTHFVKGLDYTLLRKMKASVTSSATNQMSAPEEKPKNIEKITTCSLLGKKIQGFLLFQNSKLKKFNELKSLSSFENFTASYFSRIAYEFNLADDPHDNQFQNELPSTISSSKQEDKSIEESSCRYILPTPLLSKLAKSFQSFKASGKNKRKRLETQPDNNDSVKPSDDAKSSDTVPPKDPEKVVDAIGDIFADVGKYSLDDAINSNDNVEPSLFNNKNGKYFGD